MSWTFFELLILLVSTPSLSKPLTDADIRKAPQFELAPSKSPSSGYSAYWLCSDTRTAPITVVCDDLGYNRLEGQKAELQLSLKLGGAEHNYGLRHGILTSECLQMKRQITRLLKKGRDYCIGGQLAGIDLKAHEIGWVFFEMKTEHGSVCDFCDWPAVVHLR